MNLTWKELLIILGVFIAVVTGIVFGVKYFPWYYSVFVVLTFLIGGFCGWKLHYWYLKHW